MAETYTIPTLDADLGSTAMFPQPLTGATAGAADIRSGKRAYTAAGLTTGTLPDYAGGTTVTENGTLALAGRYCPADISVAVPKDAVIVQRAGAFKKKSDSTGASETISAVMKLPANAQVIGILIGSAEKVGTATQYYTYAAQAMPVKLHDPRSTLNTGEGFTQSGQYLTASYTKAFKYGCIAVEMLVSYYLPGMTMTLRSDGTVDLVADASLTELWDFGYSCYSDGCGSAHDGYSYPWYAFLPGPFRIHSLDLSRSGVTRLPMYALANQDALASLAFPADGALTVENYALMGANLGWSSLPACIASVGTCGLANSILAENFEIGTGVALSYAMFSKANLKKVWIRDTVTTAAAYVFLLCSTDLTLYCEADEQPAGFTGMWNGVNGDDTTVFTTVWGQKERPW